MGSGGVSDAAMLFQPRYPTAVTMEEESQAGGGLWWTFPFFRGVGQSLEAARNFGPSLYFTLKGKFTLLREEGFGHSW